MGKRISVALVAVLVLVVAFSGCKAQEPFKSKEADAVNGNIKIFTAFDSVSGMKIRSVYITQDLSGYLEYIYSGGASDIDSRVQTRLTTLNKNAFKTTEDYDDGYRILYYNPQNNTQDTEGKISIKIQFANINFLKSEIRVMELSEYMTSYVEADNHFVSANSGGNVSLVSIDNKVGKYVLVVGNDIGKATTPITITVDKAVYSAYQGTKSSITQGTVNFTSEDYKLLFAFSHTPVLLIVLVSVTAAVLIAATVVRFVVLPRRKMR